MLRDGNFVETFSNLSQLSFSVQLILKAALALLLHAATTCLSVSLQLLDLRIFNRPVSPTFNDDFIIRMTPELTITSALILTLAAIRRAVSGCRAAATLTTVTWLSPGRRGEVATTTSSLRCKLRRTAGSP